MARMRSVDVDVLVIGSGPAGAVVACAAAQAGARVMIAERGPWFRSHDYGHHDATGTATLFKDGGLFSNKSVDFYILQGECVGGSSAVSNAICYRPPPDRLDRWRTEFGFPVADDQLQESVERVYAYTGARPASPHTRSRGNELFLKGCDQLGLQGDIMDKFIVDCLGCGFCTSGCAYERKRTVQYTYIPEAIAAGAVLVPECDVQRLNATGGEITHVDAVRRVRRGSGSSVEESKERLRISARTVVLTAGAIGSSKLLLRSGLGTNVGRGLAFNMGSCVHGEWPEEIDAYRGDNMCSCFETDEYVIEPTIYGPGSQAVLTPTWFEDHFAAMTRYRRMFSSGMLVPSGSYGRVTYGLFGSLIDHEAVDFRLSRYDRDTFRKAIARTGHIFFAAGARKVYLPFIVPSVVEDPSELDAVVNARLNRASDFNSFGSAHPMGGNVLSDDPARGTVDQGFRVRGMRNLYCCDASVFPTALKVNPMLTIMAIADHVASRVLGFNTPTQTALTTAPPPRPVAVA